MGAHQDSVGDTQKFREPSSASARSADLLACRRRVRLVVVEAGAGRLAGGVPADDSDHTVVSVQSGKHTPANAVRTSIARIQALEQSGHRIDLTILMLAPRFDIETTAARIALALALATHSATTNSGSSEILLAGSGCMSHAHLRAGVLALVDVLTGEPENWSLPVHVQFVDAVRSAALSKSREFARKRPP